MAEFYFPLVNSEDDVPTTRHFPFGGEQSPSHRCVGRSWDNHIAASPGSGVVERWLLVSLLVSGCSIPLKAFPFGVLCSAVLWTTDRQLLFSPINNCLMCIPGNVSKISYCFY